MRKAIGRPDKKASSSPGLMGMVGLLTKLRAPKK
jgi:hypothetical protein